MKSETKKYLEYYSKLFFENRYESQEGIDLLGMKRQTLRLTEEQCQKSVEAKLSDFTAYTEGIRKYKQMEKTYCKSYSFEIDQLAQDLNLSEYEVDTLQLRMLYEDSIHTRINYAIINQGSKTSIPSPLLRSEIDLAVLSDGDQLIIDDDFEDVFLCMISFYDRDNQNIKTWDLNTGFEAEFELEQLGYSGEGKLIFSDIMNNDEIMAYIGEFSNGRLNGYGEIYYSGELYCKGQFKNGKLYGEGTTYLEGNIFKEGTFKDDKLEGFGRFYLQGTLYSEGLFSNDELNGQGTTYHSDGRIFTEGNFVNGKLHGYGTSHLTDTIYDRGEFVNGDFQGETTNEILDEIDNSRSRQVRCPLCDSTVISTTEVGFGIKKAALGYVLAGPLGTLAGFVDSGKIKISCLSCGYSFNRFDIEYGDL